MGKNLKRGVVSKNLRTIEVGNEPRELSETYEVDTVAPQIDPDIGDRLSLRNVVL